MDLSQAVYDMIDLVNSDRAEELPVDELLSVERFLDDHMIERFARPSAKPREAGHPGASPEQLAFAQAFEDGRAGLTNTRIFAAAGGNQSGKTSFAGGVCFCKHLRDDAVDGSVYWVLASTLQTLRDIPCKTLWNFLPRSMFGGRYSYSPATGFGGSKTLVLTLPGGRGKCEIWLWTEEMNLNVIESARLHGVWWTECKRESIFPALQPRLAKFRGFLLMDYVPRMPWHVTRVQTKAAIPENGIHFQVFTMPGNAHNLPPGEPERQRRTMTESEWAMRGLGKASMIEGLVYPQFQRDTHLLTPFPIPMHWPRWRMIDYGRSAPTACAWGTVAPIGWQSELDASPRDFETLLIYREHYRRALTLQENAGLIRLASSEDPGYAATYIDPHAFDLTPAAPKSIAEQYADEGMPCFPWPLTTTGGEDAMIEIVRKKLENRSLMVFKTAVATIAEFESWQYARDRDGNVPADGKFEKRNNHLLDAIRGWAATGPMNAVAMARVISVVEPDSRGSYNHRSRRQ